MSAVITCDMKPSDFNNTMRQFMSDCRGLVDEIAPIRTGALPPPDLVPVGFFIWSQKMLSKAWLICNGQSLTNYPELRTALGRSALPNLNNVFIEHTRLTVDLNVQESRNKQHKHKVTLSPASSNVPPFWRGATGFTQDANRYFWAPHYFGNLGAQSINGNGPHPHTITIASEGGDEFQPNNIPLLPLVYAGVKYDED